MVARKSPPDRMLAKLWRLAPSVSGSLSGLNLVVAADLRDSL